MTFTWKPAVGLSAFLLSLATSVVDAAPCAGFDDIDDSSAFCANVAWMKNRGITFGCAANLYCPNESVTRIQMAAFISRLQSLLPPTVFDASGQVVGSFLDSGDFTIALYRKAGELYTLPIQRVSSIGRDWRLYYREIYFDQPGCGGQPFLDQISYSPVAPMPQGLVWGPSGETLLYAPDGSSPLTIRTIESYRRSSDGTCVTQQFLFLSAPAILVENLTGRFAVPLSVR